MKRGKFQKSKYMNMSSSTAFESGNPNSRNHENWVKRPMSADRAIIKEKPLIEGRLTDLVRNNGFISAGIQTTKDSIVGEKYRLQLMPSYKVMGIDIKESNKWATQVEALFNSLSDDAECFFDARRQNTFSQIIREAIGMDIIYGESFFTREWRPNKTGFSTCWQSIAPPRIETPFHLLGIDNAINERGHEVKGGIAFDSYGEAVGYYISKKFPGENSFLGDNDYVYVPKYNEYGWLNVIHIIDRKEPSQSRGVSQLAGVINSAKLQSELQKMTIELAIASTKHSQVITSPYPDSAVLDDLSGGTDENGNSISGLNKLESIRAKEGEGYRLYDKGVAVVQLLSGEKLEFVTPQLPINDHLGFMREGHLNDAKAFGLAYEQFTGDFSKSNFASSRMSTQIAWQFHQSKGGAVAKKLANLILRAFVDEAIVKGVLKPPAGVGYWANRSALLNANWIGAGRMVIDEVKAAKGAELRMNNGLTTQQNECADYGLDWQEVNDQRQYEEMDRIARGLNPRISEAIFIDKTEVNNDE